MLNDTQIKSAHMYAEGVKITDIAKLCGCSRQSIYEWKEKDEWKAEVDRWIRENKNTAEKKLSSKIETYIGELEKLALTGKSEKTRSDCLQYLINRVLGNTTTKVEDITDKEKKDDKLSWDDLETLENTDNVIELDSKKA